MPTTKSRKKGNIFSSLDDEFDNPPSQEQDTNETSSPKDSPTDSDLLRELCSKLTIFSISMDKLGKDFNDFKNESTSRTKNLEDRFDAFIHGKPSHTQTDASDASQQSTASVAPKVPPRDTSPSSNASTSPSQPDDSRQRKTPRTNSTGVHGANPTHNSFPPNTSGIGATNFGPNVSSPSTSGNTFLFAQPFATAPSAFHATAAQQHFASFNQPTGNPFGTSQSAVHLRSVILNPIIFIFQLVM